MRRGRLVSHVQKSRISFTTFGRSEASVLPTQRSFQSFLNMWPYVKCIRACSPLVQERGKDPFWGKRTPYTAVVLALFEHFGEGQMYRRQVLTSTQALAKISKSSSRKVRPGRDQPERWGSADGSTHRPC